MTLEQGGLEKSGKVSRFAAKRFALPANELQGYVCLWILRRSWDLTFLDVKVWMERFINRYKSLSIAKSAGSGIAEFDPTRADSEFTGRVAT